MNSESDKKGRRIYDDETEDDDDDTRSIISTDSEASKNTITTDNSDTYIEDFDNKSEKEFTQDKLEDVTDDMLFNMDDENTEPDEPNDVDVIDNSKKEENIEPETQEISDNSSLLIHYDLDNNLKPKDCVRQQKIVERINPPLFLRYDENRQRLYNSLTGEDLNFDAVRKSGLLKLRTDLLF